MRAKKYLFFGILMAIIIITAIILNIEQRLESQKIPNNNTIKNDYLKPSSDNDLISCKSDNDCIKVPTQLCCSCSNGGGEQAINKKYEQYWLQERVRSNEVDCSQAGCAAVYNCSRKNPVCGNNVCAIPTDNLKNKIE